MGLWELVFAIILIGIVLWVINKFLGPYVQPPYLHIANTVVVIVVALWLLKLLFGFSGNVPNPHVGH